MEIIKEFGLNPILLIAQIVNFAILLFLLQRFLYKPILKILDERKQTVAKSLKDADEIEKRLEKTAIEQEKLLTNAKNEALTIINDSKKESKELSERTLAAAKKAANEILVKNQERLVLERDKMMSEVKREIADLVTLAVGKVSKKAMDQSDNQRLVKETLNEMDAK